MDDAAFALEVLKRGLVDLPKLQEAQRAQEAMRAAGMPFSLHEILVRKGLMTAGQVQMILASSRPAEQVFAQETAAKKATPRPKKTAPPVKPAALRRSSNKLWLGVAIGSGVSVLAVFIIILAWPRKHEPVPNPAAESFMSEAQVSTLRGKIKTTLFANQFNEALSLLEAARDRLRDADFTALQKQIESEALGAVTSLLPSGGEEDALDQLSKICERLKTLRDKVTQIPAALSKLDAELMRLTQIAEADQSERSLERIVSPLVYARDFDGALKACREQLSAASNPYAIEKIRSRIEEIQKLQSFASSSGTSEEIQNIIEMARAALVKGDRTGALWTVRGGLQKAPRNADLLGMSALCQFNLGQYVDARRDAEEALGLDPRQGEANLVKGILFQRDGLNAEAVPFLTKALERYPELGYAYVYRAYAYYNVLRYEEAIRDSRDAERHDRRSHPVSAACRIRVLSLIRVGRIDEAIAEATRWIALQGWNKSAWAGRADAFLEKGDAESARRDLKAALRLDPSDAAIRSRLDGLVGDVARGNDRRREPPPPVPEPFGNDEPKAPAPAPAPDSPSREPGETTLKPAVIKAMDKVAGRLTELQGGYHLVVLVDVSPSMEKEIKHVAQRMKECLGGLLKERNLKVALATYDARWGYVTEWESSLDPIMRRMDSIQCTGTGREMLMAAVEQISTTLSGKSGNRAIIVLTDEVGSDREKLERAIAAAKNDRVRVFVIGPESPFGWPFGYEQGNSYGVATDVGPETARMEILQPSLIAKPVGYKGAMFEENRLQLGRGESVLMSDVGFDMTIGSGFGPYALVRLSRETGGEFFFLREPQFEESQVSHYAADWCSLAEYDRLNKSDRVRWAVTSVVSQWPLPEGFGNTRQQLEQFKWLPFMVDRSTRNQAISDARGYIKRIVDQLAQLDQVAVPTLKKGESRRWEANLDLVKGQLASMKHYLVQYVLALQAWSPPPEAVWGQVDRAERNDAWSEARAAYDDARRRLEAVINQHPRTPWAETAGRQLDRLGGFTLLDLKPQGPGKGGIQAPPPKEKNK